MAKIFSDFSKIDLRSKDGAAQFVGAVNHFFRTPTSAQDRMEARVQELVRRVQEATTTSDFPATVKDALATYRPSDDEIDTGYEAVFDIRDFTQALKDGFKIRDTSSGLTFAAVPEGGKAKVYKVTGSETSVSFSRYGGALEWDRTWFDDQDWWSIEDRAKLFRYQWYYDKAEAFYGLMDAMSAGIDLAWQATGVAATDALYELDRDIRTINAACNAIVVALDASGMGVTMKSEFVLTAPVQLMQRIVRALGASYRMPNDANSTQVVYNVKPQFTTHLDDTTKYYVGIPKRKAKGGNRQELTILTDFDILSYCDLAAGWGRYGGAIGTEDQFQRCSTS